MLSPKGWFGHLWGLSHHKRFQNSLRKTLNAMTPSGHAQKSTPKRAWQRMLSGRRLDLLDPAPLDIEVEDIAHGLSRVARWNGQTSGDWAYSVAEHSLLVERIALDFKADLAPKWRMAALLHDASEYVIGDLITPFKAVVGHDYKTLEGRLTTAVYLRFGLPGQLPQTTAKLIKRADRTAAYLEATQLAGFSETEASKIFSRPRRLPDLVLTPLSPGEAKQRFLKRFAELQGLLT